jgi:hypothetical protein
MQAGTITDLLALRQRCISNASSPLVSARPFLTKVNLRVPDEALAIGNKRYNEVCSSAVQGNDLNGRGTS